MQVEWLKKLPSNNFYYVHNLPFSLCIVEKVVPMLCEENKHVNVICDSFFTLYQNPANVICLKVNVLMYAI